MGWPVVTLRLYYDIFNHTALRYLKMAKFFITMQNNYARNTLGRDHLEHICHTEKNIKMNITERVWAYQVDSYGSE